MFHNGYCYVSIFLSPINQHVQIFPCNGTVIKQEYDKTGKFNLATDIDKCRHNEKAIHYIMIKNYSLLKLTQISGFLPRCISYIKPIDTVSAGDYLGMIKFGSRVDLLFPIRSPDGLSAFQPSHMLTVGQKITYGNLLGKYQPMANK
jgi:phosphatidylserine decarboxylase